MSNCGCIMKDEQPTSLLGAYLKAGLLLALVIGSVWMFRFSSDLYNVTKERLAKP